MKRYSDLWDRITAWENLVLAARKAQRGKRGRLDVQRFNFAQERELLALQRELVAGTYRPGLFQSHWIREPKKRLISVAPYRDRVVHHALMNILEPILERHFHPDSYACRKARGTHLAVRRLQSLMHRHKYVLKCDIQKFFPSIDHEVMKATFMRLIKDARTLALMDLIVDSSNPQEPVMQWFPGDDLFTPAERRKGLPIGNLTSQWFANWMLSGLDHYITSVRGFGAYLRYCDDFLVLGDDRAHLRRLATAIIEYLGARRLVLHRRKLCIRPVTAGVTFVGYRVWPTHILVRKPAIRRMRRRVKWLKSEFAAGRMTWPDVKARLASWIGHAGRADSRLLIGRLAKDWRFSRGRTDVTACYPRRQLEQQCDQLRGYLPQQQHAIQSQQQQRISSCPALSQNTARNRDVHGHLERGSESPGPAPVRRLGLLRWRQMFVTRPCGAGSECERPICAATREAA